MTNTISTEQAEQKRWRVSLATKVGGDSIGTFTLPADDLFQAAEKAKERYPACNIQSVVLHETPEQKLAATQAVIEFWKDRDDSPIALKIGSSDVGALWTDADSARARAAGWDLTLSGGAWHMVSDDDSVFESDGDLAAHLRLMADVDSELEKRAIHAMTASNSPDVALFNSNRAEEAQSAAVVPDTRSATTDAEAVTVRRMRSPHGWRIDIKSSERDMFVATTNGTSVELREVAAEMERDAQRRLKRAAFIQAGADALHKAEAQAEKSPTPGM
jgi:hypothetical protein